MSLLSGSTSRPNYTSTFPPTSITPRPAENERIFFQTAAARGISGIFVWLSLIITGHQVRNRTSFGFTSGSVFVYPKSSIVYSYVL